MLPCLKGKEIQTGRKQIYQGQFVVLLATVLSYPRGDKGVRQGRGSNQTRLSAMHKGRQAGQLEALGSGLCV